MRKWIFTYIVFKKKTRLSGHQYYPNEPNSSQLSPVDTTGATPSRRSSADRRKSSILSLLPRRQSGDRRKSSLFSIENGLTVRAIQSAQKSIKSVANVLSHGDAMSLIGKSEKYAWDALSERISDWLSRFMAVAITFLFVVSASWSQCFLSLTAAELFTRFAIDLPVSFVMDLMMLHIEQLLVEFDVSLAVATLEDIQFGYQLYSAEICAVLAPVCAFIATESGLYSINSSCFQ
jgi:hypothetical protein